MENEKTPTKRISSAGYPESELSDEKTLELAERVQSSLREGRTLVFTRAHRLIDGVEVRREVSEWRPDRDDQTRKFDIGADDGSAIALWDPTYTITEKA